MWDEKKTFAYISWKKTSIENILFLYIKKKYTSHHFLKNYQDWGKRISLQTMCCTNIQGHPMNQIIHYISVS